MQKPPALEALTRGNLNKPLHELIHSGELLSVTDPMLTAVSLSIQVDLLDDLQDS